MKTWTRTLNMDDAHDLLALAEPGVGREQWTSACQQSLPHLSMARRRELIRLLRDDFLTWTLAAKLREGLFITCYAESTAMGQIDLLATAWAMSHPLTLVASETLIGPALNQGPADVPLADVERLVAQHVVTESAESRRKTRTVLLGALEGIGTLDGRGTGKHRALRATRGAPHPSAYGYLLMLDLQRRRIDGVALSEALYGALPSRLTHCTPEHARHCLGWCQAKGQLELHGDMVRAPDRYIRSSR